MEAGSDIPPKGLAPVEMAYLARQPILDRSKRVVGYEILQRPILESWLAERDDEVTMHVAAKSLLTVGLGELGAGKDLFLNSSPRFVAEGMYLLFPAAQTVLEVLERTEVTDELIDGLVTAKQAGYRIALDDYVGDSHFDPLLAIADIVKFDYIALGGVIPDELVRSIRTRAPRMQLLAEKVETAAQFAEMRGRGFDLFQGFFFARPDPVMAPVLQANHNVLAQLIGEFADPDCTPEHLSELILLEPRLSYQVLGAANCAAVSLQRPVSSISDAIILLGTRKVSQLALLLTLCSVSAENREALVMSLVRAKMCEVIASRTDPVSAGKAFIVGLVSLIDAMTNRAMPQILPDLALDADVTTGILTHAGDLGEILQRVISYEVDDEPEECLIDAYAEAVHWTSAILRSLVDVR